MKKSLFSITVLCSFIICACSNDKKIEPIETTSQRQPLANNISMVKELDSLYTIVLKTEELSEKKIALEKFRNTVTDKYATSESLFDFIPDVHSEIKMLESKDHLLKIFSWKTHLTEAEDYDHLFIWNTDNKIDFKSDFSKEDNKHTIKNIHQFNNKNKTYYVVQTSTEGADYKENKLVSFEIANHKLTKIPLFKKDKQNISFLDVSAKLINGTPIKDEQLITVNEAIIKVAKKSGPYLNNDFDTYVWQNNFFVKQ